MNTPLRKALALALAASTLTGCAAWKAKHGAHPAKAEMADCCAPGDGAGKGDSAAGGREVARATAPIAGAGIRGTATLTEFEGEDGRHVRIVVDVQGSPTALTPGKHGVHLHAVGTCEGSFTTAGGHFDPGPAGNSDPDMNHPFHMGDLPNLVVDARGHGRLEAVTTRVTLSPGPLSVFDADGTAIIIHRNEDRKVSGPKGSGVSGGPRIACGVLMR